MVRTIPKQIIVEVTSRCNLRCKLCPAWTKKASAMDMDYDLYTSIIDRAVKEEMGSVIIPWMNGEPLLHPMYYDMIRYLTDRNLPAYITTNGTIWNEKLFQHILDDTSVYQLIFSLDGLWDKESRSIEIARPGSRRSSIKAHIETFLFKKNWRKSKIDVCIKICRRGQDWEEIENFISYWLRQEGIDYVCVGDALGKMNEESMRIYPCQYGDNNFMVIKSDGRVVKCAYNDEATNDHRHTMGSVCNDEPLLDIYNNSAFKKFREDQRKGIFSPPCDLCSFPYTGAGFRGTINFRNPRIDIGKIYYHRDYYNAFFSLKERVKDDTYYGFKKDQRSYE